MLEITKKHLKRKLHKHPRPANHLNIKHLNLLKKVQKKTNIQAQRFPLSVKNDALSEKGDHLEREIEMKYSRKLGTNVLNIFLMDLETQN